MSLDARESILRVRSLSVDFDVSIGRVHAVRDVDLDVHRGEVVAIVGESGSGKSTAMLAVMGLLAPNARVRGSARLGETELIGASPETLRAVRGRRVGMIFQDPMTSLNPVLTIGKQLTEAVRIHQRIGAADAKRRAVELLEMVAIPRAASRLDMFPHQLSGGMRQRVMIAMALSNEPDVLIADEPTTALDVTIQAQVIDVLRQVQERRDLSIVLVTHDLGVVAGLADTVAVMYAGAVVETGDVRPLFREPAHPYTSGLLACSPRLDSLDDLEPIPGNPPVLTRTPAGCSFAPRCTWATSACLQWEPVLLPGPGTRAACIRLDSDPGAVR